MAIKILPTRSDLPAYEFTIELEQRVYLFEFNWNDRMGRWLMYISKEDRTRLLDAIPVVINWPLNYRYVNPELPPGTLFAFDPTGSLVEPGRDDLGERVQIAYDESVA